jgi:hypothetical protein
MAVSESTVLQNVKFLSFGQPRAQVVKSIENTPQPPFFYPVFHFGDFRYCWGRAMTFWNNGRTDLAGLLESIRTEFRAGSSISIFFSLGLYVPLRRTDGGVLEGLRFEREYGHGSTIADAQEDLRRLLGALRALSHTVDAKTTIAWAMQNIGTFYGEWKDDSHFEFLFPVRHVHPSTFRKQEACEQEFFKRKFNHVRYCTGMTQRYYYSSDAWRLKTVTGFATHDDFVVPVVTGKRVPLSDCPI